jgi:uncharacterized repeat protein (TIGR03803 family)
VNGTSGGNTTYGAISTGGLYQAPTTAPAAYIVTVSATSAVDSTKSGSFSVLIAGTIASVTQPITASAGGTISLPGGDSVTIPAGDLNGDSSVTLQLTSVAEQPTNTLFGGIGPSLLMSFSPAVGGVGAAARESQFRPNATSNATAAAATSDITFVLQSGQGLSATQLQNALGVLDVTDGTDNFFAIPSSYDASQNATTLQVDPSLVEPGGTLSIGLTLPLSNSVTQTGDAVLEPWNESTLSFTNLQSGSQFCPTGQRTLVLIHGMFSSPEGTFAPTQPVNNTDSWAANAESAYSTIIGIQYTWWDDINGSAQSIAKILNSLFDSNGSISPCNYQGTIDIEAHSEGTIVTLTSAQVGAGYLSESTVSKIRHVVLVAGPIDGTPVATNPLNAITFGLNLNPSNAIGAWMPAAIAEMIPAVNELQPGSSVIAAAQAGAKQNLTSTEIVVVGGDKPYLDHWWETIFTESALLGIPNDGIIPVSSALPSDSTLPNLVRLVGNDPSSGNYPYPDNHTHLVNDPNVMKDVLSALNGAGETSQVTLGISPQSPLVLVDQSIPFAANTTNILNPQIQWTFNSGTTDGTLSSSTGTSVQYLAPQTPGGPFPISATLPAIIQGSSLNPLSSSTSINVDNPVPTITAPLVPVSLPVGSASQTLTINGTGFVAASTVTFNGNSHQTTLKGASQLTISLTSSDLGTVGAYPVVVTNSAPGGGSATATFTVTPIVAISPSTVSVPASSLQSFTAAVSGGGPITWTVEEGTSGGTITSSGIYTAPSQTGTYHVIATSSANTSESATAIVDVVTGPTITTIHSFNHATEGAGPWSAPVWGADGDLYGVTELGGDLSCAYISSSPGCGTIYKSDTSGSNVTTLHSFVGTDGAYPYASLTAAAGGVYYGTTQYGGTNTSECWVGGTTTPAGCGSVFSYSATAGFRSLLSFGPFNSSLGVGPLAPLVQTNGTLYGETPVGGNTSCTGAVGTGPGSGCGSIFSVDSSNTPSALHTFSGSEGAYPRGGLLLRSDGYLYGTTEGGGTLTCSSYASLGCGTVFQMNLSGTFFKTLRAFKETDGADPRSPLILGSDGNMYGTTVFGGSTACSGGAQWQGCGTVFKIDAAGNFMSMHSFSGPDGAYPTAIMQASDGYFYGTTEGGGGASCTGQYGPGCGTVFRMDSAGNVTVLYSFTGQSDGSLPASGVVQGTDGNLYGTAVNGGVNDDGVIFRISNLTALISSASIESDFSSDQPAITPVLRDRPHVGPLGPPTLPRP